MPNRGRRQGARTIQTRWMLAAVVVSVLSGCMVGPDYQRPVLPPPAVFRGTADPAVPPDPTSLGDLQWFEVFKDDQLQALIRTALVANYDLRDAVARVNEARANLGITRSEQFPNIAASADITTVRASRNGLTPIAAGVDRDRTVGGVLLNLLSFEVDVWGRLRRATEAARAQVLAAEDTRQAVLTTLVSDVATAYFALVELDAELEIAQRTLALRQQSLRLIEVRQQGGIATLLDVRQAEQLVYSAAAVIPDTERLIEQTENQIRLLLGQPPGDVPRGQPLTAQAQPPTVPPGLPSALLERRPDIRAAEQTLIAANANIGVAKAAYFPTISLTGLLGFESNQLSSLFKGASSALAVCAPGDPADLYRGPHHLAGTPRRGPTAECPHPIRKSHPNGLPRGVGCPRAVSPRQRDPHAAGLARDHPARPVAVGLHALPGRRRYAAQCAGCRS